MKKVYCISWYLYDRWGTREEGGCSLHINKEDFNKWHEIYYNKIKHNGELPDCYYIPYKEINFANVTEEIYKQIISNEFGFRFDFEEEEKLLKEKKIIPIK